MRKMFGVLLLSLLIFSCASGPSATEPVPQAQPQAVDLSAARSRAAAAQEKAKTAKADVAVKADYGKAQTAYSEAQSLGAAGGDAAIAKYLEAEKLFLAAASAADTKREEALKQLNKAKSDIKSLEEEAAVLQQEQEGGAR